MDYRIAKLVIRLPFDIFGFGYLINYHFLFVCFFFLFSYFFQPSPLGKRISNSFQIGHSWYPKLHFIEKKACN